MCKKNCKKIVKKCKKNAKKLQKILRIKKCNRKRKFLSIYRIFPTHFFKNSIKV